MLKKGIGKYLIQLIFILFIKFNFIHLLFVKYFESLQIIYIEFFSINFNIFFKI
jgi:hypothetical protein